MKKKYNSAVPVPQKAGRPAGQLETLRRGAIVRQIPYHRKTRQRRR